MSAAPDLRAYRHIVVAFSGGKDSLAALLHLLQLGVRRDIIELHHHDVDGGGPTFMDWPCTADYVRAIAAHLGLRVYFSWREGGFERELDRDDAPTAPRGSARLAATVAPGRAAYSRKSLPTFGCGGAVRR